MTSPKIHIISFQRPDPPSYGGVIDMYYRIKACHDIGLHVILHTFHYNDRTDQSAKLNEIADEVYYYDRSTGMKSQLSVSPYIVESRRTPALLENLCKDQAPILFEGLHTTGYLNHPSLNGRIKIVRAHNIEHNYYKALAFSPGKLSDRAYFIIESIKLRLYEKTLRHADIIASLNTREAAYFRKKYTAPVVFSPVFFDESQPPVSASGDYVLYHGNLTVAENVKSAFWILENITRQMPHVKFVFAGYNPPTQLKTLISQIPNAELHCSPSEADMEQLIDKARIHLLVTFQSTGVKLKLLHVLQRKGSVIANSMMTEGTALERYCHIADTPDGICRIINDLSGRKRGNTELPPLYHARDNIINFLGNIDYYRPFLKSITDSASLL